MTTKNSVITGKLVFVFSLLNGVSEYRAYIRTEKVDSVMLSELMDGTSEGGMYNGAESVNRCEPTVIGYIVEAIGWKEWYLPESIMYVCKN